MTSREADVPILTQPQFLRPRVPRPPLCPVVRSGLLFPGLHRLPQYGCVDPDGDDDGGKAGDLVETEPSRARQPIPRVTRVVALQPGILVTANGYAGISREGTGEPAGPGASDIVCGCGHCGSTGLDERWWHRCELGLLERGAALAETDGDRNSVFFPQTTDFALNRADVIERCCSAGMVRDTLRLFSTWRTARSSPGYGWSDRTSRTGTTLPPEYQPEHPPDRPTTTTAEGVKVSRTKGS